MLATDFVPLIESSKIEVPELHDISLLSINQAIYA